MREQLNNNPMVQIAVVVVLVLAGGIFVMSMGGGDEEAGETAPIAGGAPSAPVEPGAVEATAPTSASATLAAIPPVEPPAAVVEAWESGATVVLLFVRESGIDDRLVRNAAAALSSRQDVTSFVVPAQQVARYTAITGKVGVDRVPALVVLSPKSVNPVPTASVQYGYLPRQSIVQAVIDAGYEGPPVDYHP